MKNQRGLIQIPLLVAIIAGVLVLGGGGYFGVKQYQNYQAEKVEQERIAQYKEKETQAATEARQKALDEAQQQKDLEVERLRQEIEALKNKGPQIIQQTIVKEVPAPKTGKDIPSIIKQWRPRIAHIVCEWKYSDTGEVSALASGSGVLMKDIVRKGSVIILDSSEAIVILTNKHVLKKNNQYTPDSCDITLPGMTSSLKIIDEGPLYFFRTSRFGFDWGVIVLHYPTEYIKNLASSDFSICTEKASVGDEVVILGYPAIGSQTDITATEGIISGYDGNYYITSAKIDQGNSGGAAISLKDNCYLGIPTFAQVGEIESLARILDIETVYKQTQ